MNPPSSLIWFAAVAILGVAFASSTLADTTIYDDGTWRVVGADDLGPDPVPIALSVGGVPSGNFSELKVYRAFEGGMPQAFSVKGNGALLATTPPTGVFGGTFHLTQYWDCFDGPSPSLAFLALDIEPATGNARQLNARGRISNGDSLEASDLSLKFEVDNDSTARIDVRYTLYALRDLCLDPFRRELKDAFRAVRITSNYLSPTVHENDGVRVVGVVGKVCDCCDCYKLSGSICSDFVNTTDYVYSSPIRLANETIFLLHSHIGPANTPTLKITVKSPSKKKLSVQGFVTETDDPNEENVEVWINWDKAKKNYRAGKKIGVFQFVLSARIPEPKNCDYIDQ